MQCGHGAVQTWLMNEKHIVFSQQFCQDVGTYGVVLTAAQTMIKYKIEKKRKERGDVPLDASEATRRRYFWIV